jgi:agmatine deiminase
MPPEWAPHRRCWIGWPCNPQSYPADQIEAARDAYAAVARAIARFEPVTLLANPEHVADAARRCGDTVTVRAMPLHDSWLRDTGPTWLVDGRGRLAGVDWPFNAWGEIYSGYEADRVLARRLLEETGALRFEAPIVLEGGAVHTDGEGTLLTTESVVLNPNRNPGLTAAEAERVFRAYLGVGKVIWLDAALEVDSTDGHVDNLACFARPGLVLALSEPDPADPHHEPLQENLRRLRRAEDARGRKLEIVEIRQPARREWNGDRLPQSYINFYIANGGVVLPVFDDPADEAARKSLSVLFPDRQVVPVAGTDIVKGDGCVHCITQQEPLP